MIAQLTSIESPCSLYTPPPPLPPCIAYAPLEAITQSTSVELPPNKATPPPRLPTLPQIVEPTIDQLDQYLIAAREAIQFGPEFKEGADEVVFEDFEDGTYDGWEVTGDAFGAGPQTQETIAPYQGDVKVVDGNLVFTDRQHVSNRVTMLGAHLAHIANELHRLALAEQ